MEIKNKKNLKIVSLAATLLTLPLSALAKSAASSQTSVAELSAGLLLIAMVIGTIYNLWKTTRAYGGLIGDGMRRVGVGILFFSVEALDRVSLNFGGFGIIDGITPAPYVSIAHDALLLLGLSFVTWGFIKLSSAVQK